MNSLRIASKASRFDSLGKLNNSYSSLANPETSEVTTFSNGLKIVSENKPGHFAAIGFYVDAGSRYESPSTYGFSHLIDRLSFKTTQNKTSEQNSESIESLGGNISCFASRECIMYQAAVFSESVKETVSLLGEVVFRPKFDSNEITQVKEGIPWELADISSKPDIYLNELFHELAYKGNTLGNPLLCPESQLELIDSEKLKAYHNMWFSPDRVVIAAIGVDHQKLVDLCKQAGFDSLPKFVPSTNDQTPEPDLITKKKKEKEAGGFFSGFSKSLGLSSDEIIESETDLFKKSFEKSNYTGGIEFIQNDEAEFTNLQIGFESVGVRDEKKLYAYAALQMLLGGGGSFSAGGPGKGMYSRLYTRVLNQYAWVESCLAFHNCYTDSGVFGISASCRKGSEHQMLETCIREILVVANSKSSSKSSQPANLKSNAMRNIGLLQSKVLTDEEVNRAKNMLKSSLLMNMESRIVQLEDLGRQIQVLGFKNTAEHVASNIDLITADDLASAASDLLKSPVTMLASGKVEGLQKFSYNMLSYHGIKIPTQ
ncbi:Mitochondrial-processing peptidase subunit alpha [Smittium culicis]|uniref:Alpha-MPP n=1 Tax=Smittium culicis TaxID=133412 RepID=A0A1R1YAP8_9FUNG|nr:Mitochondrial-processing peptidase subunit alpha [Smittium culicis]